jgi:hypothetical protein
MLLKAHMGLMGLSPVGVSPADKVVEFAFDHLAARCGIRIKAPFRQHMFALWPKKRGIRPVWTGCIPTFPRAWTTLRNGHLADAPTFARS